MRKGIGQKFCFSSVALDNFQIPWASVFSLVKYRPLDKNTTLFHSMFLNSRLFKVHLKGLKHSKATANKLDITGMQSPPMVQWRPLVFMKVFSAHTEYSVDLQLVNEWNSLLSKFLCLAYSWSKVLTSLIKHVLFVWCRCCTIRTFYFLLAPNHTLLKGPLSWYVVVSTRPHTQKSMEKGDFLM
jgi:hypothetical protein